MKELADHLSLDDRQIRRAVDSLEKRGLVRTRIEPAKLKGGRHAPTKRFVWLPYNPTPLPARHVRDFVTPPPTGGTSSATTGQTLLAENRARLAKQKAARQNQDDVATVVNLDDHRR